MSSFDKTEVFRVTVRLKSGGDLDLGTWGDLHGALAAVEEFKADRPDVLWESRATRSVGDRRGSYVIAIGRDGVTDPSIVVTRVEARTR